MDDLIVRPQPPMGLKKLEAVTNRIRAKALRVVDNGYDIGVDLRSVFDSNGWREKGYPSFQAWVQAETPLTFSTAWRLMQVAETFTLEEVRQMTGVGKTKLFLLASAPVEDREELKKKVMRERPTDEQLRSEVRKRKEARGQVLPERRLPRVRALCRLELGKSVEVPLFVADEHGKRLQVEEYRRGAKGYLRIADGVGLSIEFSDRGGKVGAVRVKFVSER